MKEILAAVKNLNHAKSRGSDGFTVDYLNISFKDIVVFLLRSVNT